MRNTVRIVVDWFFGLVRDLDHGPVAVARDRDPTALGKPTEEPLDVHRARPAPPGSEEPERERKLSRLKLDRGCPHDDGGWSVGDVGADPEPRLPLAEDLVREHAVVKIGAVGGEVPDGSVHASKPRHDASPPRRRVSRDKVNEGTAGFSPRA